MHGSSNSAQFCPTILVAIAVLGAATIAYALFDARLRARAAGRSGLGGTLRSIRPSVLLWELPFLGFLVFLYVWCMNGLYSGIESSLATALRIIVAAGVAVLPRLRVADFCSRHLSRVPGLHAAASIVLLAACISISRLAVEVPWNDIYEDIALQYVAIEVTIIGLFLLALYFLGQRRGVAVAVGVGFMLFVGVAQYFVFLFKDANITPADLQAIGTAIEVSGDYVYTITSAVVLAIAYSCGGFAAAAYLMPPATGPSPATHVAAPADGAEADASVAPDSEDGDAGATVPATASAAAGEGMAEHDEVRAHAGGPRHARHARERIGWRERLRGLLARPGFRRTALGLLCVLGLALFVTVPGYGADFGVSLNHWNSMYSTSRQGFFPCFVKEFQARLIPEPEGYSDEAAQEYEDELVSTYEETLGEDADTDEGEARAAAVEQFSEEEPCVITIMNESFSDLSVYKAIAATGYDGPQFVKYGIKDAIAQGDAYTSIFGGGTCNSEFEMLCGVNLHYLGSNKYPYTQWDFNDVDCLPRQFAELGYDTTAIHPNEGTNWDRNRVYSQMGFDEFYTIDDFEDAETYHDGYVSDKATYEKILEILESSDDPQFIHDVTMQNHGPFTSGTIPEEDQTDYQPAGADAYDNYQLNEYLACVQESDEAIEWFLEQLSQLDRPVVVLFFGDHQPKPAAAYTQLGYSGEDSILTAEREYHTMYFMWANYDIDGVDQTSENVDESVSSLGDVLMYKIGAPLNDRQKASLASQSDLPIVSLIGYQDADGNWHAYEDEDAAAVSPDTEGLTDAERTDSLMAYVNYLEFGSIVN